MERAVLPGFHERPLDTLRGNWTLVQADVIREEVEKSPEVKGGPWLRLPS